MYSEPNKLLFNREDAVVNINVILKQKIDTALEIRNYGSNFIVKAYEKSENELIDTVLILNFVLKSVNLLDSIIVLSKEGCHSTIPYLMRGIIENSFYIEWLLQRNSKKRAEYFYTYMLYEELSSNSFAKNNPEGFIENMKAEDLLLVDDLKSFFESSENQVEKIRDHLKTYFAEHYERLKKKVPPKWYAVNNDLTSLKDLAEEINRKAEYKIFYQSHSKSIHSGNLRENLKVTSKGGEVTPIRSIRNLDGYFKTTISYMLRIYRQVMHEYLPSEKNNFRQIYKNRWRQYFME